MTERKKADADKIEQHRQVEVAQTDVVEADTQAITCGLIMPIASNEGGTAEHWRQVRQVITSAISGLNLKVQMVSESDAVSVIHKNIIQNIFTNEIVICDVSSRNPNVMFELGMRLAFDKPVVIIKDRETPFSFDIGSIQHIEYPHSLNYIEILEFQNELLKKVRSTMSEANAAKSGGGRYSPFLSNYSITEVAEIKTTQVNKEEYIIGKLSELTDAVRNLDHHKDDSYPKGPFKNNHETLVDAMVKEIVALLRSAEKKGLIESMDDVELFCKEALEFRYSKLNQSLKDKVFDATVHAYMNS
ncbi:hypothetical protein QK281_08075 [Aeromonas hydrophila]|uniref:hypothetical protein n=1 Tax=Aeromonas hydrophila TaxID=644 RepID=UPI00249E0449|nr:hypothetical protein [Aeromonas hydrophila]WGY33758.1 hypothetical protein QK281_08075 [Aeromonas hydrophila]HDC4322853.1 hypothetical protein [Aeromonas hydrophila]